MEHHGKVAKDTDNGIWSAHCTCHSVWDAHSWFPAFREVYNHVKNANRPKGFGFRADIQ